MKKALAILVCTLLVLSSLTPAFARGSSTKDAIGMSIIGFSATELHGGTVTGDIIPQVTMTVVNEWATWCGPCVSEMPHFQTMHEYYSSTPEADVQILGSVYVSGSCTPQSALQFVDNNGYTWPNVVEDNVLAAVFNNSNAIPNTIIVDRHGIVRDMHTGSFSSASQLQNYIQNWLETLEAEEPDFTPGDVDCDGSLTVTDALMILRRAMGILQLPTDEAADYNGDGTVDVSDALTVLRVSMGLL